MLGQPRDSRRARLSVHAPRVHPGSGGWFAKGRSRRFPSRSARAGLLLPFLALLPGPVAGCAVQLDAGLQSATDDRRLCLSQLGESPLPADFDFVGLTASEDEDVGTDPVITLWSRSALLVATLSHQVAATVVARVPLTDVVPLSAALAGWDDGGLIVELFDPRDDALWTANAATGEMTRAMAPTGSVQAAGALRNDAGWVWAQQLRDPLADTSRILISAGGQEGIAGRLSAGFVRDEPQRGIDRLLHLRSDGRGGYLVQQAGFPFGTIRFASDGEETWRTYPEPEELRALLGETDLGYVMATPAVALDDAVLTTFTAVRSRRRISSLTARYGRPARYQAIPADLAFLAVLPQHGVLIGTRAADSRRLIFLGWRWIDQRQRCT